MSDRKFENGIVCTTCSLQTETLLCIFFSIIQFMGKCIEYSQNSICKHIVIILEGHAKN